MDFLSVSFVVGMEQHIDLLFACINGTYPFIDNSIRKYYSRKKIIVEFDV